MSETLLEKEDSSRVSRKTVYPRLGSRLPSSMDNDYFSSNNNLFDFDTISDDLKHHRYSRSKLRSHLCRFLLGLHSYPLLIIIFSFFIGLAFFGIPMALIYFNNKQNIINPIIFILFFSISFSILLLLIRCRDDIKNKLNYGAKWERKNFLKNLGLSLTLIILSVSAFFLRNLYNQIIEFIDNFNDDEDDKKQYSYDFFMKYIINISCYLIGEKSNEKICIKKENQELLYNDLRICCVPLVIFCFNKIIKIIIIQVKHTFPNILVFFNFFLFTFLIILFPYISKIEIFSLSLISLIEIILLSLIFLGYIIWTICEIYKLLSNPKDKNFGINRYECSQILFILLFDVVNIFGASFIYISLLICYFSSNNIFELYDNLNILILISQMLKIGFLLLIISNSYYYGHHLLSLIFRPIALQYTPAKLKENYVRIKNRNYSSFSGSTL
jgi:hypothetical protein